MFESICVRSPRIGFVNGQLDLGMLAEILVFYQRVQVVADAGMLSLLIKSFGPELLLEYIARGHLSIDYLEDILGIHTEGELHTIGAFSFSGLDISERARVLFTEAAQKSGKGRRLAQRFEQYAKPVRHDQGVLSASREDFADAKFVTEAVQHVLTRHAPEYTSSSELIFSIIKDGEGYRVFTNIDFVSANSSYHLHVPEAHSSLSVAYLLSAISAIQGNIYFASKYDAEIAVEGLAGDITRAKFDHLLRRRLKNDFQIENFQDFVLPDGLAIAQAINDGSRTFRDLLPVLDGARKFKEWLQGRNTDSELLRDYILATAGDSWLSGLQRKAMRWTIFTAAGLIAAGPHGGLGGIAVSAIDAFLCDRLFRGWKPNQFVNDSLRPFVDSQE